MKKLRIALAGGGTGGHIIPLIAVAQELNKQSSNFGIELDMRYFGSAYDYAELLMENGIRFVPIYSSKFRRYWSALNLIDFVKFFLSLFQLFWKLFWFMPDMIFSKGGPGALAVVLAGRFYMIPTIIHESDSVPGLTNKISGRFAKKIFLSFAKAEDYFSKNKNIEVVGNPVRESLFQQAANLGQEIETAPKNAKRGFGMNPEEPLILVLGGSQGAERLNNFILENLGVLTKDFQILHQVGKNNYQSYKNEYEFAANDRNNSKKNRYTFKAFFNEDMADALMAADLVISRAGSGNIFEIAAFGKPAILVPLPESANNHQKENAYLYSQSGGAIIIEEENLLAHLVMEEINKILKNKDLTQKMGSAAKSFYRPDAAFIIAKHLLGYL